DIPGKRLELPETHCPSLTAGTDTIHPQTRTPAIQPGLRPALLCSLQTTALAVWKLRLSQSRNHPLDCSRKEITVHDDEAFDARGVQQQVRRQRGFDGGSGGGGALLNRFRFGLMTHRLIAPRSTSRSGAAKVIVMTPRSARHTTRYSSPINSGSPSTVYR